MNDLKQTQSKNVHIRLGKCDNIMWATLSPTFKENKQISSRAIKTIMVTMLIPTLLSGLSAIILNKHHQNILDNRTKLIWRKVFGLS